MTRINALITRKASIAEEIADISSMRKGVLNEQFVTAKKKDGQEVVRGPYYVLTRKGPYGRTVSQAIPAKDSKYVRAETEKYKRFKQLSENYIDVCEQISMLHTTDEGQGNE